MEVAFGGSYKKYKLIQDDSNIDLYNNVTGHRKRFMRIHNSGSRPYLTHNSFMGNSKQNKKIQSYLKRRWTEFYYRDGAPSFGELTLDEITFDFLLYISKNLREYKLDDLLSE